VLISPEHRYAQNQEDGSWKCVPYIFEDFAKRKIPVLGKDNPEVKAMIAEK